MFNTIKQEKLVIKILNFLNYNFKQTTFNFLSKQFTKTIIW